MNETLQSVGAILILAGFGLAQFHGQPTGKTSRVRFDRLSPSL